MPAAPASASLCRCTTRTTTGPGGLETELVKVRDARIGYSQGELTAGSPSAVAPAFDARAGSSRHSAFSHRKRSR
nr:MULTISPECIES: IclR family transcriptional regulator C-terminal domain-containing protein [unclassified Streptomyces]